MMATATPKGLSYSTEPSAPLGGLGASLDASAMAKGILTVLLDTLFFEVPEAIPTLPSGKWSGSDEDAEQDEIMDSPTETEYFLAYPNPFSQQVTIAYELKEDCAEGCFLRIFDMSGRLMFERSVIASDGPNSIEVDMGIYESGMYLCSLYSNQWLLQTSRLVKLE